MSTQAYFLAIGAGIVVALIAAVAMIRPFRKWRAAQAQEKRLKELESLEVQIRYLSAAIAEREERMSCQDLIRRRSDLRPQKQTAQEKKARIRFLRTTKKMEQYLYELVARRIDLQNEIRAHQPPDRC